MDDLRDCLESLAAKLETNEAVSGRRVAIIIRDILTAHPTVTADEGEAGTRGAGPNPRV